MTTPYTIVVLDSLRIKGKPVGWFPAAEKLVAAGVPVAVAQRWERTRYQMTAGLKRRVKQDVN